MADGTRLNQLQERLAGLKRYTESQFKALETEMMVLKMQSDSMIQQLTTLTLKMQKKNSHHTRDNSTISSNSINERHEENSTKVFPRSVRLDFPSFHGDGSTSLVL